MTRALPVISSHLDLCRHVEGQNVHAELQLRLGRHLASPHKLCALRHVGVLHHGGHCNDRLALGIVGDERGLLGISDDDYIVIAANRVSAVPELTAERRPEDLVQLDLRYGEYSKQYGKFHTGMKGLGFAPGLLIVFATERPAF